MRTEANIARRAKLAMRELEAFEAHRRGQFSMALYNEWERAYDLLIAHEQGLGAHADTTRPVDAGTPEHQWDTHNHVGGRACRRLCPTNRPWDWDGRNNRVKS